MCSLYGQLLRLHSSLSQTNTFQCVLATNGTVSFATFLYVDGHMQWTASDCDNGGALEVGFLDGSNSGSYLFPPDDLTDIDTGSNAGYPGKWLFRVDRENLITPDGMSLPGARVIRSEQTICVQVCVCDLVNMTFLDPKSGGLCLAQILLHGQLVKVFCPL